MAPMDGEVSDGVKKLLDQMVESRVSSHVRQCEVLVGEAAVGWRRSRSSWEEERVGTWARRREEENARLEREAHWLERIAGRNLSRRGHFPQL